MRAWIPCLWAVVTLIGCTLAPSGGIRDALPLQPEVLELRGDPLAPKKIFVFFDGTRNDGESHTNVRRLYDAVSTAADLQTTAMYLRGVGTATNPYDKEGPSDDLALGKLIEQALGKEMQSRILLGHHFIAQHYQPGDQVFLFGFSRGAHQARSLAGMISYAGVPARASRAVRTSSASLAQSEEILEIVKKQQDDEHVLHWEKWKPGTPPPLAGMLAEQNAISVMPVEIAFLGLWDTVPGSSLKGFGRCKEEVGFIKRNFSWLIPGVDRGERYKVDSYPPIRKIVHAVSADEKRSKFLPILACPPLPAAFSSVVMEMQFPGAHADVGGGYEDLENPKKIPSLLPTALPGLSLNWMVTELSKVYSPVQGRNIFPETALGLAHWSIGESPGNMFSHCVDRNLDGIPFHASLKKRLETGKAPLLIGKTIQETAAYPRLCVSSQSARN
jgi:hypothetical protein